MEQVPHFTNNVFNVEGEGAVSVPMMLTMVNDSTLNVPATLTFWQPSAEELAHLASGRPVVLCLRIPPGASVNAQLAVEGTAWAQFEPPSGTLQ